MSFEECLHFKEFINASFNADFISVTVSVSDSIFENNIVTHVGGGASNLYTSVSPSYTIFFDTGDKRSPDGELIGSESDLGLFSAVPLQEEETVDVSDSSGVVSEDTLSLTGVSK